MERKSLKWCNKITSGGTAPQKSRILKVGKAGDHRQRNIGYRLSTVDSDDPEVIILSSGSEVRGFDPTRGRWIFSERNNPEYDFLRKGSKGWVS